MRRYRQFVMIFALLVGAIFVTPVQAAPATFTDSGSTLLINLGAGEQLTIVSSGTSYTFQTNQTFADGGVTNPGSDFSAFGGTSITLTASGLARYDTISITDSGAGAAVIFGDSGGNTFSDSFTIVLDAGSGTVTIANNVTIINGGSLTVTAEAIDNAAITTADGNIVLSADTMSITAAINVGTGIVTLAPSTAGRTIDLGGLSSSAATSLVLTDTELDRITADIMRIGSATAGSIIFSNTISPAGTGTLSLITGDAIVDDNAGVDVQGANLALQTVEGIAYTGGDVILETEVDVIAALNTTSGGISLLETFNGGNLIVGTVDGVVGIRNTATVGAPPILGIQLETTNGDLTVNADIFNQRRNMFIVAQQENGGAGDRTFTNNANIVNADSGNNTNNAKIDIRANNMTLAVGSTISAVNQVTLEDDPSSIATVAINLGGADGVNTLGLTDAELDTVTTAGVLQIGHSNSGGSGNINVFTPIDLTDTPNIPTLDLLSGAAIGGSSGKVLAANTLNVTAGSGIGTNGDPFAVNAAELTTAGSGDQYLSEADSVTVGDNDLNAGTGHTIQLAGGTFLTTSSGGAIQNDTTILSGATLGGAGTVTGTVTAQSGGAVAPGTSPGLINTGSITFTAGSNFNLEVNGLSGAGTDYDQLNVSGSVIIDSAANLVTSGTITSTTPGAEIIIINNDGGDAISGNFSGLSAGAAVSINGQTFRILYDGGDGNDVSLIENTAPTLTAFTRQDPATSPTNADSLVFRATFSEDVQNVDTADFAVNGTTTATVTGVISISASVYEVTISGGDLAAFNGTVGLDLSGTQNIEDLAGNALPAGEPAIDETYSVDNTAITVTINQAVTQADPTNAPSLAFTTTFSEPVAGFTTTEVLLGGTAPGVLSATVSGGPAVYTVTVSGMTGTGTVTAAIEAGVVTDLAGNGNLASTSTDNVVTFDPTAPLVTNLTAADITIAGGATYSFTVVYSDDLALDTSSFDGGDIRVTGPDSFDQLATLLGVTPIANGTPRTVTYQITAGGGLWDSADNGAYSVTLQADQVRDTAGNTVPGGTLGTFNVDIVAPGGPNYPVFLPLVLRSSLAE